MEWFIDFDDVLTNSRETILDMVNKDYNTNFQEKDVKSWTFKDCFPNINESEIEQYFNKKEFFDKLTWKNNMKNFLISLSKSNTVTIVTKGEKPNLINKHNWLKEQGFSNINFIGLNINQSKGIVDMSKGVFIDDNENNLYESNAMIKILFENYPNKEWNSTWKGIKVKK